MGILTSRSDLQSLRTAGQITQAVFARLAPLIRAGITTPELETTANQILSRHRSTAPFKQFDGFNHAICVSINAEIVNGPPSRQRTLEAGDVVKIATASEYRGIHAKAARTYIVPGVADDPACQRLRDGTLAVVEAAQRKAPSVNTLNQLLSVVPETAAQYNLTVIAGLGGFGIGKKLHEPPLVPNHPNDLSESVPLVPGLAFTLMPMFSLGSDPAFETHEDGWTYLSRDRAKTAHVADTLLVTEHGLENITAPASIHSPTG